MKCLIVEDDRISSQVVEKMISRHAAYDSVVNGKEAAALFQQAHREGAPYDLVLMDIMVPEVDGLQAVREIRRQEEALNLPAGDRVKIIMTTALNDPRTIMKALYESDANSYLVKPIKLPQLEQELRALKLIA